MKRLAVALLIALFALPLLASEAAVSLADPDGQELILEDLSIRTAINGMLSLTELDFHFRNPKAKRMEGRFTCTLPTGAAISRFAKEINGVLMEGEVVERLRANQVYEQFLHQMRDPAMLEQDQGNRFSARIFPIDANARVRVLLSYTTLLPMRGGMRTYTLPLRGTKLQHLSFRATVTPLPGEESVPAASRKFGGTSGLSRSTAEVFAFEEDDTTIERDVELSWRPSPSAARYRILRAGDFYLASLRPAANRSAVRSSTHDWLFYVDTSASSAEGAEHRIAALEALLRALPPDDRVTLRAFDQEVAPLRGGSAPEIARVAGGMLRARLFLGGTDAGALLRDATRAARERPERSIVIASDMVPTLGTIDRRALNDLARAFPSRARVDVLVLGPREDAAVARAVTAGRGRIVRIPFSDTIRENARRAAVALQRPLGSSHRAADPNAEWIYPTHVDDVAEGDEIIILGRTGSRSSDAALRLDGAAIDARSTALAARTFEPLLEREAYRAYLDNLAEREANEESESVRKALANEQVRISVEQRVVIPRTTLLVLESESDYQRFGLDRRSLAAILTIDGGEIARIDKRVPPPMPVRALAAQTAPQARDLGRLMARGGEESVPPPVEADAQSETKSLADAPRRNERAAGAITVTGSASVAAPPPPPPAVRPSKRPMQTADALRRRIASAPLDREGYNMLSETLVEQRDWSGVRGLAIRWQAFDPENPQVYELLGLADEQLGRESESVRAHASLIEIAPAKPELLQRAGLLLARSHNGSLAEAPLRRALEMRPDRVNSYRHLALMLWLDGRVEEAARVLESATRQNFPQWYGDSQRIVREELGYVYRAWIAKEPSRRDRIAERARDHGVDLARVDALRVSLAWETDANDVDLHVTDPSGEECFYQHPSSRSGLQLYQDITQGLGPEVIRAGRVERGTYRIGVHYYAAGPMGISRGIVVVMRNDNGRGQPSIEIYPFRLLERTEDVRQIATVAVKG
jgi:tetratricopeptide (TPR) repeat protein